MGNSADNRNNVVRYTLRLNQSMYQSVIRKKRLITYQEDLLFQPRATTNGDRHNDSCNSNNNQLICKSIRTDNFEVIGKK